MAFWSGEELGLQGSFRYAAALTAKQARAILIYANVDMIASPNGFAGVYDEPGAPVGSSAARDLLSSAVKRAGGTPVGVDLDRGSDPGLAKMRVMPHWRMTSKVASRTDVTS